MGDFKGLNNGGKNGLDSLHLFELNVHIQKPGVYRFHLGLEHWKQTGAGMRAVGALDVLPPAGN